MDQQIISLMIGLFVLIGVRYLFLYVWQAKHACRLPKKAYPLCCLVVCGSAFVAGFFLAGVMFDSTFSALGHAFRLDRETSELAAKVAVSLIAVLPASLAGLWVLRKVIHSAAVRDS
jgi:uncharacterized membrane protein YqjE